MNVKTIDGLLAGGVAAVVSGAPSTAYSLVSDRSPLEATVAAGSLVAPHAGKSLRLAAAVPVHLALSLGWGVLLAHVLPRKRATRWGALAGLGIAAVDLGIVGRRLPEIEALPKLPQVADHVAYGATVGLVLEVLDRANRRA